MAQFDRVYKYKALFNRKRAVSKQAILDEFEISEATFKRDLDKIMSVHALGVLPTPADVADAIAFLCSPAARTITGVLLPVDSGWAASVSYMTYAGGVPWDKG